MKVHNSIQIGSPCCTETAVLWAVSCEKRLVYCRPLQGALTLEHTWFCLLVTITSISTSHQLPLQKLIIYPIRSGPSRSRPFAPTPDQDTFGTLLVFIFSTKRDGTRSIVVCGKECIVQCSQWTGTHLMGLMVLCSKYFVKLLSAYSIKQPQIQFKAMLNLCK